MATGDQLRVRSLHRYPVKSMLGEAVPTLNDGAGGAEAGRRPALIDDETGRVASTKQARLWRLLLKSTALIDGDDVRVRLPDGTEVSPGRDDFEDALSALESRPVGVATGRPAGASLERATEAERYWPNIAVATPPGYPASIEYHWAESTFTAGSAQAKGMGATPRCAIPTLEHGDLGREVHALRTPATDNLVDSVGFGRLPCAGARFAVVTDGAISLDDPFSMV